MRRTQHSATRPPSPPGLVTVTRSAPRDRANLAPRPPASIDEAFADLVDVVEFAEQLARDGAHCYGVASRGRTAIDTIRLVAASTRRRRARAGQRDRQLRPGSVAQLELGLSAELEGEQ